MKNTQKKLWLIAAVVFVGMGGVLLGQNMGADTSAGGEGATLVQAAGPVTVYKSPTCGCCGNYVAYLRREGYDVTVVETQDMTAVKQTHNVPMNQQSCHTMVFEKSGYVVEGHVPVEAVNKLVSEQPAIDGIGMPGMPAGSPGMPGMQRAPFEVYSFNAEGDTAAFLSI